MPILFLIVIGRLNGDVMESEQCYTGFRHGYGYEIILDYTIVSVTDIRGIFKNSLKENTVRQIDNVLTLFPGYYLVITISEK